MKEKQELRKSILKLRNNLDPDYRAIASEQINHILIQKFPRNAKVVHAFLPMGSEVNIYSFINWLLKEGKTVVCPKTLPQRKLENRILLSLSDVENGVFGTRHPREPNVYKGEIDLFLIPGLAFSSEGKRLGYGGGYYDTLLSKYPNSMKWAVCFQAQIVSDLPTEKHDIIMDRIVSA